MIKRAIVTPDKHFPQHDQRAINVVCKAIARVKPEIYVDLGDTGEWKYFSKHYWKGLNAKPMEDLVPLLEKDVKAVNKGMDQIDKALDAVNCKERHFVQGNHEVWLDDFVRKYPYMEQYTTENALRIAERGYEYHPYFRKVPLKIGKLNFTHGHRTSVHHAKAHLAMYKESVMYGHTHDLQRFTETGLGGTLSAWSLGCLKDVEEDEDWLRGNLTNWNHAFAIVHFFPNGNFNVEVVEIYKGKTVLWGELISGTK
tara:strand:+ start:548 stop:1312 length:765 start_codon:yes stop_codon:yes gene_type:complete